MIKPTIIIVLMLSIAGYLFCSRALMTHVTFKKTSGYHTFLMSAGWGIFLAFLHSILFLILSFIASIAYRILDIQNGVMHYFGNLIEFLMPGIGLESYELNILLIVTLTWINSAWLPKALLILASKLTNTQVSYLRYMAFAQYRNTDDTPEFTSLCFRSGDLGLPIAFTLNNRKVYIGYPNAVTNHINDIEVLPILSGYRCEKTLNLKLTTDYEAVMKALISKSGGKENLNKFLINLPIREITHANLHDIKYHDLFAEFERKPKTVL